MYEHVIMYSVCILWYVRGRLYQTYDRIYCGYPTEYLIFLGIILLEFPIAIQEDSFTASPCPKVHLLFLPFFQLNITIPIGYPRDFIRMAPLYLCSRYKNPRFVFSPSRLPGNTLQERHIARNHVVTIRDQSIVKKISSCNSYCYNKKDGCLSLRANAFLLRVRMSSRVMCESI